MPVSRLRLLEGIRLNAVKTILLTIIKLGFTGDGIDNLRNNKSGHNLTSHKLCELFEEIMAVLGARTCFWVVLYRKDWAIVHAQTAV